MPERHRDHHGLPRPGTSELLRHLLVHDPTYRSVWVRRVERAGRVEPNQAAVARVLAHHLWETGERDEADPQVPRRLRDTVNRALAGDVISRRTLEWFIDAFEMDHAARSQLWARYAEDQRGKPVVVEGSPDRTPVPASHYRTISLDEQHFVGADGLPTRHETVQVIQAEVPMDRYSYVFDTDQTSVEVFRGGTPSTPYRTSHPRLYALDIHLPDALEPGDTAVLGYRNNFRYRETPDPEFRRVIRRSVRSVLLQVRFHPARVPARAWFAHWTELDAGPESREPMVCDANHSVHRYLQEVKDTMVGFCWEWD